GLLRPDRCGRAAEDGQQGQHGANRWAGAYHERRVPRYPSMWSSERGISAKESGRPWPCRGPVDYDKRIELSLAFSIIHEQEIPRMAEQRRENSLLISLKELRDIEEDRVKEEEDAVRAREDAERRAKEEAIRRAKEAEEAKIRE